MKLETITQNQTVVAHLSSRHPCAADVQSALELILSAKYEANTNRIAIDKRLIAEEFFQPGSGLAGELLEQCSNYNVKIAIYGDYAGCACQTLTEFLQAHNQGRAVFFVETKEKAIQKLAAAA